MSLDAISFEKSFGMVTSLSLSPTDCHQLRFKAAVLNEKAKRSMEKVAIARKNADIAEEIHQIKTDTALRIVFEATEFAHSSCESLGSSRELLAVISDIRKQQYVEAALAAVEASDAQHVAEAHEAVSTKLLAAAKLFEDASQIDSVGPEHDNERAVKIALADSLIVAIVNEESCLSPPIQSLEDVGVLLQTKECERTEAIQRVKTVVQDLIKNSRIR